MQKRALINCSSFFCFCSAVDRTTHITDLVHHLTNWQIVIKVNFRPLESLTNVKFLLIFEHDLDVTLMDALATIINIHLLEAAPLRCFEAKKVQYTQVPASIR